MATQQANMVAAYGAKDSSYMRIGSLDGYGDFRGLAGSGRLNSAAMSSYPPSGMLGRLNSPTGLSLHGLASSGLIQTGHTQSSNNVNTRGKLQSVVLQTNQSANLFQGIPTSLELDQLQQRKCISTQIGNFSSVDDPTVLTAANGFPDGRMTVHSSNNSLSNAPRNPLMLQSNPQQTLCRGGLATQSSLKTATLSPEPYTMGVSGSSNFLDHGRCNENWQSALQMSKFPSTSLPMSETLNRDTLTTSNLSSTAAHIQGSLEDSREEMQCQSGLIGNVVQNINYGTKQRWEEQKQDYMQSSNNSFGTLNSIIPANNVVGPLNRTLDQNNAACGRNIDMPLMGQSCASSSSLVQHTAVEKSAMDMKMVSNDGLIHNNYGSLDDLMSAMIKRV